VIGLTEKGRKYYERNMAGVDSLEPVEEETDSESQKGS